MSLVDELQFENQLDTRLRTLEQHKPHYDVPRGFKSVDSRNLQVKTRRL